jgi:hypothetical protein
MRSKKVMVGLAHTRAPNEVCGGKNSPSHRQRREYLSLITFQGVDVKQTDLGASKGNARASSEEVEGSTHY